MHKFTEIGWISPDGWKKFGPVYVATDGNQFVGVCNAVKLNGWTKIGPLVVVEKHQEKSYDKQLLAFVVNRIEENNIFIGSSNPKVISIARSLKFKETTFSKLPNSIKSYLLHYSLARINPTFLANALRKRLHTRYKYHYFVRIRSSL